MKAKVVKSFKDKHTGEIYPVGKVLSDISEERFAEILTVGPLVERVEEPEETKAPAEEKPKKNRKK